MCFTAAPDPLICLACFLFARGSFHYVFMVVLCHIKSYLRVCYNSTYTLSRKVIFSIFLSTLLTVLRWYEWMLWSMQLALLMLQGGNVVKFSYCSIPLLLYILYCHYSFNCLMQSLTFELNLRDALQTWICDGIVFFTTVHQSCH